MEHTDEISAHSSVSEIVITGEDYELELLFDSEGDIRDAVYLSARVSIADSPLVCATHYFVNGQHHPDLNGDFYHYGKSSISSQGGLYTNFLFTTADELHGSHTHGDLYTDTSTALPELLQDFFNKQEVCVRMGAVTELLKLGYDIPSSEQEFTASEVECMGINEEDQVPTIVLRKSAESPVQAIWYPVLHQLMSLTMDDQLALAGLAPNNAILPGLSGEAGYEFVRHLSEAEQYYIVVKTVDGTVKTFADNLSNPPLPNVEYIGEADFAGEYTIVSSPLFSDYENADGRTMVDMWDLEYGN